MVGHELRRQRTEHHAGQRGQHPGQLRVGLLLAPLHNPVYTAETIATLDVISRHPGRFEVFALSGASRVPELMAQCLRWRPRFAVMPDAAKAAELRQQVRAAGLSTEVLEGEQALCDIAAHPDVDVVMGAIVGAAGLPGGSTRRGVELHPAIIAHNNPPQARHLTLRPSRFKQKPHMRTKRRCVCMLISMPMPRQIVTSEVPP